jgi:altronate hydrolase
VRNRRRERVRGIVRLRRMRQIQMQPDHFLNLFFISIAVSGQGFLNFVRRIFANRQIVLCRHQNRDATRLASALSQALGYSDSDLAAHACQLAGIANPARTRRPFANIDGIRAITLTGGCGGAASDCESLGRLLAGYADHPNVAGLTVLSLGCEKLQFADFQRYLHERNPGFTKPLLNYRRQDWHGGEAMLRAAVEQTLALLAEADKLARSPQPLSKLKIGVKCGGSDGFSGISANPVIGLTADRLVALGGAAVLAEFPELCGAEGDIAARCATPALRARFLELMHAYEKNAAFFGTSISDNPSWGNIHEGLITDAIKSAGAAKKGGRSPIVGVADYTETTPNAGLSLLCTPGNDLLSVTGQVGTGCNLVLFSTGLGTPTGNPIAPVLKIATNTTIAELLDDIIDYDCGPVIDGMPLNQSADGLFEKMLACASGAYTAKADHQEQYDFMFWKRSVDL